MPMHDGSAWDPIKGAGRMHRLSVDLTRKNPSQYGIELLYGDFLGSLERQDDRYQTVPYRIGFMPARMAPRPGDNDKRDAAHYVRFDHVTRQTQTYQAAEGVSLAEASFAPKSRTAREGEGWLMGVASHAREQGRCDLLIFDAEHLNDGPVATVKTPTRVIGQVHGWWLPDWERQAMPARNPITGT
jgi:carotenoid cleavage dioxygenase